MIDSFNNDTTFFAQIYWFIDYLFVLQSSHEAVEEVLAVMMKAYGILHSSANRHVYKSNVLPVISAVSLSSYPMLNSAQT